MTSTGDHSDATQVTMKIFSLWLAITITVYGLFATASHHYYSHNPHRIMIILDSSFAMKPAWRQVEKILTRFNPRRYTEYRLITEKRAVHHWQKRLKPGRLSPYAPRNFSWLQSQGKEQIEQSAATKIYMITNADQSQIGPFDHWEIIHPSSLQ
ncbi:hypothetical protein ACQZV8_00490 [Magnetococcales bacterium HHB-1]